MTPQQYLEVERAAHGDLSEYFRGRMYAMPPSQFNHALIMSHVAGELSQVLKHRSEDTIPKGLRLSTPSGLYAYPDVMVLRDPQFADGQQDVLLNPMIVIEVVSPATEAYDRGFKSTQYRTIESLEEYALVSQNEPRVEIFRRQPAGGWLLTESAGLESACRFESLGCQIALADIYERVTFTPDELIPPRPPSN
jgi:Uma2 family endonuclease